MKKTIFLSYMVVSASVLGMHNSNLSENRDYKTRSVNAASITNFGSNNNLSSEKGHKRRRIEEHVDESLFSSKKGKTKSEFQQSKSLSRRNIKSDLIRAVKNGRENRVRHLIEERNMDVNLRDDLGKTLLYHAVYHNHEKIVKYLVRHGADVNAKDKKGFTPIMFASDINIVKYLAEHNAKLNIANECGDTFLHFLSSHSAMENDHVIIVKYLVDHGADVNLQNEVGNTPLHLAARINNEIIAKYLIDHDSSVNKRNLYGNTPLIYAILNNNIKLVQYLRDHGANTDYEYAGNNTALTIADNFGRDEIVSLLKKS